MDTIGVKLYVDQDMTNVLVSNPVSLNNMVHLALHAKWTGTPQGTLFFEVSAEVGDPNTWEVFDSVAINGAGTQLWIDRNVPYIWARVRYAPTASTGDLTLYAVTKGDK